MQNEINIKKGLDLNLKGIAQKTIENVLVKSYAIKPSDYLGVTPKLIVKEGDRVKAGSAVFYSKQNERIIFTSTVSGVVSSIVRGQKRIIEEIIIDADDVQEYEDFGHESLVLMTPEQVIDKLLISGAWTFLRQRPYSIIPSPNSKPKCILISGFDSSPLAPDYSALLKGQGAELQLGVDVLRKISEGEIHLNLHSEYTTSEELLSLKNVQINYFSGKHPVGNISTQVAHLDPINKGERIWYINPQDLILIGKLFLTGKYIADKIIALTGEEVLNPHYYNIKRGACIYDIVKNNINKDNNLRYISGNVLSGKKIDKEGFLGAYDNQITVIKEGDYYEFLGWVLPGIRKYSFSKTFLSGFLNILPKRCRKPISVDTNLHGGKRAFVLSGEFEKVFPLDIYPLQLIKACIIEDIDQMEQLGIYEIDAEDFALCEVIDASKTDIQQIIRNGLELMRKEMGE